MDRVSIGIRVSSWARGRSIGMGIARGAALCAALLCLLLPKASWAFPLQVTSLSDTVVADSTCSLREAITAVNTGASYNGCFYSGQTVISVPAGVITVQSTLPAVSATVTITGAGHSATYLDAANNNFVGRWILQSTGGVTVRDLTIKNFPLGGPWVNSGKFARLEYVKIENSGIATSQGGCLMVQGSAVLENAQLEGCRAHTGAAIRVNGGQLAMRFTTVLKSRGEHGIIAGDGNATVTIDASTIAANRVGAPGGGGIAGEGAVYAAGNSVFGLWNTTIAYNTKAVATATGGGTSLFKANTASMFLSSSVVYSDQAGAVDCHGSVGADSTAFAANRGCPTGGANFTVNAPQLQPLTTTETSPDGVPFTNLPRRSGGVGRVYVPAPTSPLVGLVDFWSCGSYDQRGLARHGNCAAGAVYPGFALLVVGNTTLSTGDTKLRTALENLGFNVGTVKDTAVTAATVGASTSVVVISESVTSGNVNTKLRDVDVGIVVLEPWLFDDMNMTTSANLGTATQNQTFVLAGPVASAFGFSGGLVTSTTSNRSYGWGIVPVTGGIMVHSYNNSSGTQHQFFEYPPGSNMVGGFVAPNARVGAFMTEDASSAISSNGTRLFEEAVIRAASFDTF